MFEHSETLIISAISWLRLIIESIGALVIAFGIIVAAFGFIRLLGSKQSDGFTRVRINFAHYLALGLEFQLGADILSTAVAPTWEQIGKLAAIAVIRTGLNFFLMREMNESREHQPQPAPSPGKKISRLAADGAGIGSQASLQTNSSAGRARAKKSFLPALPSHCLTAAVQTNTSALQSRHINLPHPRPVCRARIQRHHRSTRTRDTPCFI